MSKVDFRIRFLNRDRNGYDIDVGPRHLTTFQTVDGNRGEIRHYKHTSLWYFPSKGGKLLNGGFKEPCMMIKTVYNHPRTSLDVKLPPPTAAISPEADAFDSRVYRVHKILFEYMESKPSSSLGYLRSVREVLNLAFETADQDSSSDKLENVGLRFNTRSSPRSGGELERSEYESSKVSKTSTVPKVFWSKAYIALGSNLGDRYGWIEKACQEMIKEGIKVIRTSALYETEAMYVKEQDSFINGVCEVSISCMYQQGYQQGTLNMALKAMTETWETRLKRNTCRPYFSKS